MNTPTTRVFLLGTTTVHQRDHHTTLIFSDGDTLTGTHHVQDAQRKTAEEFQMEPAAMNRTHDLAHAILAAVLGLPESPTLAGTARKTTFPDWWREERAVLAFQSFAQAMGVDLEDVAERMQALTEPAKAWAEQQRGWPYS